MYSTSLLPLLVIFDKGPLGYCLTGTYPGIPPATAGVYEVGARVTDIGSKIVYMNIGTTAAPVMQAISDHSVQVVGGTIATTSTSDAYAMSPCDGQLTDAAISALVALATSDTNYITFTITNLGQAGAGSAAMLSTSDLNTTKATGGQAIVLNGKTAFTKSTTAANLLVAKGDRIRIRATATGTLANTVTVPVYLLTFAGSSV